MDGASAAEAKWGKNAIASGFTLLPNHLISLNQFVDEKRRVSPTEMLVVMQILMSWWSADKLPFPSKATIAERAGLSSRQVQRALTSLEDKAYISRIERFGINRARASNQYDVTGIVDAVAAAVEGNPTAFKKHVRLAEQQKTPADTARV